MSELMDILLAAKLRMRKELAALPFDQKLDLMEKMREREAFLAESPLRLKVQLSPEEVLRKMESVGRFNK